MGPLLRKVAEEVPLRARIQIDPAIPSISLQLLAKTGDMTWPWVLFLRLTRVTHPAKAIFSGIRIGEGVHNVGRGKKGPLKGKCVYEEL